MPLQFDTDHLTSEWSVLVAKISQKPAFQAVCCILIYETPETSGYAGSVEMAAIEQSSSSSANVSDPGSFFAFEAK